MSKDVGKSLNINEIKNQLVNYLKQYEVSGEGVYHTHTAFGWPWGKYNIPETESENFTKQYCKLLGKVDLHFTERPRKNGPFIIDIDFKFNKPNNERQYTEDDIKYIIGNINNIIKKYYTIDNNKLHAFVFEKISPSHNEKTDEFKDGFHIMYPYLSISMDMRYVFTHELKTVITNNKGFSHLKFTNTIDDVIDMSIIERNGWMMYGSKKDNGKYYLLTHIYKYTFEECDIVRYQPSELVRMLSNRQYNDETCCEYRKDINKIELQKKIEEVLGMYNKNSKTKDNKNNNTKVNDNKVNDNKVNNNKVNDNKKVNNNTFDDIIEVDNDNDAIYDDKVELSYEEVEIKNEISKNLKDYNKIGSPKTKKNDIEMAMRLTEMLSGTRATSYNDWINVCWALHNISDKLLDAWKSFSKKCPKKYNEKDCESVWGKARNGGYSIASLHFWARQDNPDEYIKLLRENLNELYVEAETGTEYDIAKVVYELYHSFYKCTSLQHSTWYEFQDNSWVEIEQGYTLSTKLSEDVKTEFLHLHTYYMQQAINNHGMEHDRFMGKAAKVIKIAEKLKKTSFKNQVISECAKLFYDPLFEEKLDSGRNLLGFTNGVYDLAAGCFRRGTPDDYVMLTTGYDYKEYGMNHPYIKEIEEFFNKVQREKDMREYVLTLLSSYLDGNTKQQKFIMWTGCGANGKSTIVEFLQLALGNYCGTFPNTVLTRKRGNASAASPELADKRGKRFVVIQEPESDDQINVGFMKELTGRDIIYARPLFKDPIEFRPQFKLLLTCNKLPFIPSTDGGTWRRLRVTPFESEFTDNPTLAHQFAKDEDLPEKMELWKGAFIWYLINKYYKIYQKQGLKEPEKVLAHTKKYKKASDVYLEFIDENLEVTKSNKDFESVDILYSTFKNWFSESYSTKCNISKKEFIDYFLNNKYNIAKGYLYGAKFKNDDADGQNLDQE